MPRFSALLVLTVMAFGNFAATEGATEYSVTDTGVFHAQSMNNLGQVVGWQGGGAFNPKNAVYTDRNGTVQSLFPSQTDSQALAINDLGQIAGAVSDPDGKSHVFMYDTTGMHQLSVSGLPYAINNLGQIVGQTFISPSFPYGAAFIYDSAGMRLIPDSVNPIPGPAYDINDLGQVVGSDGRNAFLYDSSGLHNLGTLGGSSSTAFSINNAGLIVGYSAVSSTQGHPFIYNQWGMQDLGFNSGGLIYGNGTRINESGQIVTILSSGAPGIFRDGQWVGLDTLIDPSLGWYLDGGGLDINDSGQILVLAGTRPGYPTTSLILTPVPEPSTLALLYIGAFGLAAYAWRKRNSFTVKNPFLIFVFVYFGLCSISHAATYCDLVKADGPLAYWQLNETTGTTITDCVGGHNGIATSAVQLGQPSLIPSDATGSAIQLPASGYGVTIPAFEKFPDGSLGYTTEYSFTVNQFLPSIVNIVGDGLADNSYRSFYMMQYLCCYNGNTHFLRAHYGNTNAPLDSPTAIELGTTYHVISVWDKAGLYGPAGQGYLYINGQLDVTAFVGTNPSDSTNNPMFLGMDNRESANNFTLDEVAFYNKPLSSCQVTAHYNAAVPEPSTLALLLTATLGGLLWWRRR